MLQSYSSGVVIDAAPLVSGEGVPLALTPAGLGSRVVAACVDVAVQLGAFIVLTIIDVQLVGSADSAAIAALAVTEVVLVLAGYPIASEWLSRGRTVGKACMGLRVVRDDGGPIGFRQALTRGLAGLVLEKPGLLFPLSTVAGMVTVTLSSREKRIGDMMAGTIVLNERVARGPVASSPVWVPPSLYPWLQALDLHGLDDALALRVRQFVARAYSMSPGAQYALGEDVRARLLAVIAPPPPPGVPTPLLLTAVLAERRRRATTVAAPPSPEMVLPRAVPTARGNTNTPDGPFAAPS